MKVLQDLVQGNCRDFGMQPMIIEQGVVTKVLDSARIDQMVRELGEFSHVVTCDLEKSVSIQTRKIGRLHSKNLAVVPEKYIWLSWHLPVSVPLAAGHIESLSVELGIPK